MSVGLTSGYSAIGKRINVIKPTMAITMEITIATIGRRMKNWAMATYSVTVLGTASAAEVLAAAG
jgi:hypothetical protein